MYGIDLTVVWVANYSSVVFPDHAMVPGPDFRGEDIPAPADSDEVEEGPSGNYCHGYGYGDKGGSEAGC